MDVDNIPHMNPGIKRTVEFLNDNGFQTIDSGDGKTHEFECDLDFPYIHILVAKAELVDEAERLMSLLAFKGVEFQPMDENNSVPTLQADYSPITGTATISLFNVTDEMLFGKEAASEQKA